MDADNLDKLDAAIGAMTPGLWTTHQIGQEDETGERWSYTEIASPAGRVRAGDDEERDDRDARGIATLRNVAPELLAVVRAVTDSDTIAALMLSDHPHASDCARALVAALDDLRAKTAEVLR